MSTLTLVTSLYDLSKRDANHQHRSVDWLFANSDFVLEQLDHNLVVFTEPELEDEVRRRRGNKPITVLTWPYEELLTPQRIAAINRGQLQHNATRSKVTPAYVQLMWAKYAMLAQAADLTAGKATHLGWIDVAITHVGKTTPYLAREIFSNLTDAPRVHMLRYFDARDVQVPAYWENVHGDLAGGLVVGGIERMRELVTAFWHAADLAAVYKLAPLDEGLLSYIVGQTRYSPSTSGASDDTAWTFEGRVHKHQRPQRFEYSYGDYDDILRNHDRIRGGYSHLDWQMDDADRRHVEYHTTLLKKTLKESVRDQKLVVPKPEQILLNKIMTGTHLGLVMIVKNEAHGIVETLQSFKPYIDRWTILDTGSTDGTQDLIKQTLHDIPGTLFEEPFIDFAKSRNRALDLHGTSTTFTIMPDADDRVVDGTPLRMATVSDPHPNEPALLVNIRRGELDYWLPLVLRTTRGWRYHGRVHEFIGPTTGEGFANVRILGTQIVQNRPAQSHEASAKRWERDLVLLRDEFIADPKNPRTLFYLAQTYECLSRPDEALPVYERRIEVGGWPEETFEAMLRRAKILNALKRPWPEVQQAFLEAYKFDARRAEPLFYIAEHWYDKQVHALCSLFATRAAKLQPPSTALFLDRDIYSHRAANLAAISSYYCDSVGDPSIRAEGYKLAEKAVRGHPGNELYRANWAFYAPNVADAFGATTQPIDWHPGKPYTASNPSVFYDEEGGWRAVVRTTNYTIVDGQYLTPDDNVIYTRNWMVKFDREWTVVQANEMIDQTGLPKTAYPVHGYEDCRLFKYRGKFYCSSTVCDFTEDGQREIVIIELDPHDYRIVNAWPVRGPWSTHAQKNWMPLVNPQATTIEDELNFIYATAIPTTRFKFVINETGPQLKGVAQRDNPTPNAHQDITAFSMGHGRLRGGSQAVKTLWGWLFITHDVAWPGGNGRIYLHRFVLMDDHFQVQAMTDPFYFKRRGIEFCAGLGWDGKNLVASFSVEDREANLAIFDINKVLAKMRTDFQI